MTMILKVLLELLVEYESTLGMLIFISVNLIKYSYKESSSAEEIEDKKNAQMNHASIEEDGHDKIEKVCFVLLYV